MCRHRHSLGAVAAALAAAATALLWVAGATLAADARTPEPAAYARADPETVRAHTRDILAQPVFAEQWSFWQWLSEKVSDLTALAAGGALIGGVVFWVVMVWCVLTLLAILAHFAWTVYMLVRGSGGARRGRGGPGRRQTGESPDGSFSALCERMRQSAERGRFREATGLMMAALLRWLDQASVLSFHESKTHGEYVREYPPAGGGRSDFGRFVRAVDDTVYGGAPCNRASYQDLKSLFERVRSHAGQG